MTRPPYHPDIVAQSRHLITNAGDFQHLKDLKELIETAWQVLAADRNHRTRPVLILTYPGDAA